MIRMEIRIEEMTEPYKSDGNFALTPQDWRTPATCMSTIDLSSIYSWFRQYVGI